MKKDNEKRSYYVNLLIMLLIRFPEIFSINYSIVNDDCRISFMIAGNAHGNPYSYLKKGLKNAVNAYRELQEEETLPIKIRKQSYSRITLLQIKLYVDELLPETIALVVAYMKENLKEKLLVENDDHLNDDEFVTPEDYIDFFLTHRQDNEQKNLFGFREAGKVYIYDR